jgi:Domain of unknown function (DUF4340)
VVAVGILVAIDPGRGGSGRREQFEMPESPGHIRVTNPTGVVDLSRTDSGWTVDSMQRPADPERIRTFTAHLTGTVSYPVIATSSRPDQYGLASGATIELSGAEASVRVRLGARATDGRSVYALIGDSDTVVLLPAELVNSAAGEVIAFRDLVVGRWPESNLVEVRLSNPSGDIVTVSRNDDNSNGTQTSTTGQTARPAETSILASAQRVERIAREWRAEGRLAEEVMPHQIENMFQELAALTAATFAVPPADQLPAGSSPIASLMIDSSPAGLVTLDLYAASGDFYPAELGGNQFQLSTRRVRRLTMGLLAP